MDDLKANENIVEVVPEKNQDLTQTTLVKIKGSHQELLSYLLANNTNNLSDEFEKVLQLKLDPKQKKIFNTAIKENEVAQYENGKNNPEILKYFKETGFGKIKSDKTNWCAAFVNYCVKQNGYDYPKSLVARSWVNKGEHITEPLPGDIIVLWRGKKNGWQGHVAFFVESDEDNGLVYCYGGNQDGKVCLRAYPEEQVLAYRRVN